MLTVSSIGRKKKALPLETSLTAHEYGMCTTRLNKGSEIRPRFPILAEWPLASNLTFQSLHLLGRGGEGEGRQN